MQAKITTRSRKKSAILGCSNDTPILCKQSIRFYELAVSQAVSTLSVRNRLHCRQQHPVTFPPRGAAQESWLLPKHDPKAQTDNAASRSPSEIMILWTPPTILPVQIGASATQYTLKIIRSRQVHLLATDSNFSLQRHRNTHQKRKSGNSLEMTTFLFFCYFGSLNVCGKTYLRSHHLGNLNGARQKSYDRDNEQVHQHHQRHHPQSRCQRAVKKATFPSVTMEAPFHFERIRDDPE
uniref:Uncharacterized protein n=1 Tax=Caenorhabditis japonica TaxID=281687 RepID=A0A8R1E645_CAEJA